MVSDYPITLLPYIITPHYPLALHTNSCNKISQMWTKTRQDFLQYHNLSTKTMDKDNTIQPIVLFIIEPGKVQQNTVLTFNYSGILYWRLLLNLSPNVRIIPLMAFFVISRHLCIMAPHVKSVVKKSSFHLRNMGKARRVLTEDATKTVMQSLVMSRLDYCNALLIGIQQDLIAKLQRLQNSAARIVSRTRKYEHITPVLIKLHWLPIKFRIKFKVLLLVYKALNGLAPKYIKELLVPYKPRRHLRSEAKGLLDEPRTRLKFGDRAFSISAPRLWNALPQHLKDSTSCQAFKKCLKTHLFRLAH